MHPSKILAAIMFASVFLSGCASKASNSSDPSGPTTQAATPTTPAPGPEPQLVEAHGSRISHWINGSFDAGTGLVQYGTGMGPRSFSAWSNATSMRLEMRWTSPGGHADMDLFLYGPSTNPSGPAQIVLGRTDKGHWQNVGGAPGSPDSPAVIELDADPLAENSCDAEECFWRVEARPDGLAASTVFSIRVEVATAGTAAVGRTLVG